jgi:hypothetical protein
MDVFRINGVEATPSDFGSSRDESPGTAEEYACGDMRFTGKQSSFDVLKKYAITQKEYEEVCAKLEEGLSFGSCGWCV